MSALVSVIMPVRNGGEYLAPAVESILGQSHSKLELIVVDDHSDDGAVQALSEDDPRVRRVPSRGKGVSAAFNTGLALASGEFIARMDADDLALPRRLEAQLGYLETNPAVSICGACVEIFSEDDIRGGNRRYQDWLNRCRTPAVIHRELFVESPIPNPTALFRREALLLLGGYADPDWPEDYDLFLRADALGMQMGKPDGVLLHWREHDSRLTRTDGRYALKRFQAAKIHYLAKHRLGSAVEPVIWGAGPTGQLTHDLLKSEGRAVRGFIEVHPRRIGGSKRGLPVWPVDWLRQHGDAFVLVAVGAAGARQEIREFMQALGRVEGEHYLFVA
jgi:glycosyltransferase involved in cell wall biosynthesis